MTKQITLGGALLVSFVGFGVAKAQFHDDPIEKEAERAQIQQRIP